MAVILQLQYQDHIITLHFSFKYKASANFAIVGGESDRMQEVTEKLSGVNSGLYNESARVFRKYQQYFASNKKGRKILKTLKKENQLHLVQALIPQNLSLPEKVIVILGISKKPK